MKLLEKSYHAKRISPTNGEFFFGYYDLQPFYKNFHLTHKVNFTDRLQKKGDKAEVGILDMNTSKYEKLDVTGAWNFQQGAMLQWNPLNVGEEVMYNSLSEGEYCTTILNIKTGHKRYLDRPVANVSPKGDFALSINFARMFNFRPGYGYAEFGDPFYYCNHSEKDGVFLIDLKTGKSKLILDMQTLWEISAQHFNGVDQKMIINHINFNTDGTRFVMLLRNFPKQGEKHETMLLTANTDGSDMYVLSDYGVQSHYHWYDSKTLIICSGGRELSCARGWINNYVLKDKTHEGEMIADGFFDDDNHMSYSPDRKLLLTDTYPNEQKMQTLRIYNFEKNICTDLGRFYSIPRSITDIRCDLHPRWNRDGSMVSFDSTHEGFRGIYTVDIEAIKDELFTEG